MKLLRNLLGLALLVAGVQLAQAADDKPWWDMENCSFCSNFTAHPGLMEAMQWETYELSNGSISIVRTDEKHVEGLRTAMMAMNETGQKAMAGQPIQTCGMCTAMGEVMMAGVAAEMVETPNGHISIMTSDKPELVADLHAIVERNQVEMAKMMSGAGHGDHDGHGHDAHDHDAHGHEHPGH